MDQTISISEPDSETAVLVGVQQKNQSKWVVDESLDELAQLSSTAGAEVVERLVFKQFKPDPGTFVGKGKAEDIAEKAHDQKTSLIVFDEDLTPAQGRNLENMAKVRVIDRTQLILDIFAQRAQSHAGRLQIELAQLGYLKPRLRRMWTHLERQKGGIGLTGPGEKQLEMDRRRIDERIHRLKKDLNKVSCHRAELRRGRKRHGWSLISLVGYTNAGKSTLMNALTESHVKAYDQLFATLDPTTRQLQLPNNQMALLTDTVGFIKKLPHHLVESFKATLEEVVEADLLVHVIDLSHPQVDQQIESVQSVLEELGAGDKATVHVLNKVDLPEAKRNRLRIHEMLGDCIEVSAKTGEGLDRFGQGIADILREKMVNLELRIPLDKGSDIALLKNIGVVLSEEYEYESVLISAHVPIQHVAHYRPYTLDTDADQDA